MRSGDIPGSRRQASKRDDGHHHADPEHALAAAIDPPRPLVERLNRALDEVEVAGLAVDPATDGLDLLLHAPTVDADGRPDTDPRKVLRLLGVATLRVLLMEETRDGHVVVPLPRLDALEAVLRTCSWAGTMCGGRYVDDPEDVDHWPDRVSLELALGRGQGRHRLWWFADCLADRAVGPVARRWEGHATFDRLVLLDADGDVTDLESFLQGRARWWDALLQAGDGVPAEDGDRDVPAWRPWAGRVLPRH